MLLYVYSKSYSKTYWSTLDLFESYRQLLFYSVVTRNLVFLINFLTFFYNKSLIKTLNHSQIYFCTDAKSSIISHLILVRSFPTKLILNSTWIELTIFPSSPRNQSLRSYCLGPLWKKEGNKKLTNNFEIYQTQNIIQSYGNQVDRGRRDRFGFSLRYAWCGAAVGTGKRYKSGKVISEWAKALYIHKKNHSLEKQIF